MIVLIHNDMELWDFIAEGLKSRDDVYDIPLNRYCSIINRIFRKYLKNRHLPACFVFGNRLIKIFKSLKSGDKVVLSDYIQPCLLHAIKDIVDPDVRVSIWLWNPIKNNTEVINNVNYLKQIGVKCSTFDKEDAYTYDLNHLDTFYNMHVEKSIDQNIKYDFYFLGVPKDRGNLIKRMQETLSSYNNLFIVPIQTSQYITYSENINNIINSRCIVDITQGKQHDITLRPLEALVYKKKLITNNVNIKSYPFYSPNNIFILGLDSMENIDDFLNCPYADNISDDIIEKYDINYWIERV